jgi:hypothetical protein
MTELNLDQIFSSDERIARVVEYEDGFVPLSYRWPAPGTRKVYFRDGTIISERYDRKRIKGRGPNWVAFSARNGRLASG